MAGHIDDQVSRLRRALRGPRRLKRDLLAEARRPARRGLGRTEAERAAVREFGTVEEVVGSFQEVLADR
ncbi:hypothetical protein AB0J42_24960 [Nonomuraea sp. NPDC049649]|uniref:hypothetical protein n=1 Tax=Nonomuraea sp. NPDC049649 TaxID=3155776 RepID=UPI003442F5CA